MLMELLGLYKLSIHTDIHTLFVKSDYFHDIVLDIGFVDILSTSLYRITLTWLGKKCNGID